MPKITIDGIDYHTEDLSESGLAQLASLQFLDSQMQKIDQEIAIYQTAHTAYAAELKVEIVTAGLEPLFPPYASE